MIRDFVFCALERRRERGGFDGVDFPQSPLIYEPVDPLTAKHYDPNFFVKVVHPRHDPAHLASHLLQF